MQVCRMPELSVKLRPDLELIALGGTKGDGVRAMDDRCSPLSLVTDKSGSVGRGGLALSVEHCVVCGDRASGRHYGAISCEGCKGFFKRSIRKQLGYTCRGSKDCEVTKHHRNRCQYCRLQKCLSMGMRSDSVQSERKPMGDRKGDSPTSLLSPASVFSADLSTLASVVTSLANMRGSMMPLGMGVVSNAMNTGPVGSVEPTSPSLSMSMSPSNLQVKIEEEDDSRGSREDQSGGESNSANPAAIEESASALHVAKENLITRAFEALAKNIHNGDGNNDSLRPKSTGDYDDDEEMMELDASLLSEAQVPFHLTTPSPMPVFLNAHYICESASRLLFLSVHWARSIPAFQILNPETQVALVRGSWCDLFVLGLAQCSHIMSLPAMLTSLLSQLQASLQSDSKLSTQRIRQVADHVIRLHEYVNHMAKLQVDEHEYAYLKAVVLFSYDHVGLPQAKIVEKCQNKALQELQSYVSSTWPNEAEKRLPQLLLRLPALRSLQPALLEDLFFAGLIGTVHIDSVIPYILRMEATEYNGQLGSPSGESCSPLPQAPKSSSVLQQPRLSPAH